MIFLAETAYPVVAPWSLLPLLCVLLSIPAFIGMGFLAHYLVKHDKEKYLNIIIFVFGLIFLALELYHQIARTMTLGYYDFTSIPWQVCSIPIYVCLVLPFIKKGVIKDSFIYFLGLFYIVAGSFPLLFGQGQLCRWPNVGEVFRSFFWHILIVMVAIICLSMRPIAFDLKQTWRPLVGAITIFVACTVVAQLINITCHYAPGGGATFAPPEGGVKNSDYAAALLADPNTKFLDPDTCSCFYISPFFQSNMPVYSTIWLKLGWAGNYIIYLLSFGLLAAIIYFAFFGGRKLIDLIKSKTHKEVQE